MARPLSQLPEDDVVVAKAVLRAAETHGISQRALAGIIGVDASTVSRLRRQLERGEPQSRLQGKPYELAVLLLRALRSLDGIVGGDLDTAATWLTRPVTSLDGIPLEMMGTVDGLAHVTDYLDATKARV